MSLTPISASYLFRVDSAKDNDRFFNALRPSVPNIYAGIDLKLGSRGWVPDFVTITVGESWQHISLTIIELEATDSDALISCRKYLPEPAADIIESFCEYLKRVIQKCHSSADPRKVEFEKLRTSLLAAKQVLITTAGALRTSTGFVEELSLIGQSQMNIIRHQSIEKVTGVKARTFRGTLRLSSMVAKALRRAIMVLDAVIRNHCNSDATFKAWLGQDRSQPLKYLLKKSKDACPSIRFILSQTSKGGSEVKIEPVLHELANIWSSEARTQIDPDCVRSLLESYYPIAFEIKAHERMQAIFDAARKHLQKHGHKAFLSDYAPEDEGLYDDAVAANSH